MPSSVQRLRCTDAERVIRLVTQPNPSARSAVLRLSESMSLYRAGLKLAFFLPLGVAMLSPNSDCEGFTDVSSVVSRPSRGGATLDRTPVRKP